MKYYAKVGSSEVVIDSTKNPECPSGYIEMQGDRPSNEHVATENGTWEIPTVSLDELKAQKLAELKNAFEEESKNAHFVCSLGYHINADEVANRNIEGLTLTLDSKSKTMFRTYDNQFVEVTKSELNTMRKEIALHAQKLYACKWAQEKYIMQAETADDLNFVIMFEDADAIIEMYNAMTESKENADTDSDSDRPTV